MNIVILDGYTLNPGDLSWEPIEQRGNVRNYDRTELKDVVARCKDADVVLTNKVFLSKSTLLQLPKLRLIGILATGINVVATETAAELGIVVSNVPEYSTHSVAQHTFALILELINKVGAHDLDIRKGGWKSRNYFSYTLDTIQELHGKTLGILGWGKIGKEVAKIGSAFGMHIKVTTKYPNDAGVAFVSIENLFSDSDVLTIHSALTNNKIGLVNRNLLEMMKSTSYLINTSRGQIIDDKDLADILNKGLIRGAGIDVFTNEPPEDNHPLLHARNVILTPHIAWTSIEARQNLMNLISENIQAFQNGKPINRVN